ncbi:MAG: hypothetical protein PUH24_08470, partial [Prevotellaceae bacterium]|nr:hypothetical protein [Prevotellaceae bacterium]
GWETDSKQTFTYNAEGLCTQIVHDYGIEATSGVRTITYTYTKFDSHGLAGFLQIAPQHNGG